MKNEEIWITCNIMRPCYGEPSTAGRQKKTAVFAWFDRYMRHWLARMFSAARRAVSSMRFWRVSGRFVFRIQSVVLTYMMDNWDLFAWLAFGEVVTPESNSMVRALDAGRF